MTVKLLSEDEIKRLGGLMFAPAEDAERVQASLRWAAKAYAGMSLIREQHDRIAANATLIGAVTGKRVECGCTACNVLRIILRELTPPTQTKE